MSRAAWVVVGFMGVLQACATAPVKPPPATAPRPAAAPTPAGRGCTLANGCPTSQVCDPEPGDCSDAERAGRCVPRPRACTRISAPVCGCDGVTYGNDCMRVAAGVRKYATGACPGSGAQR